MVLQYIFLTYLLIEAVVPAVVEPGLVAILPQLERVQPAELVVDPLVFLAHSLLPTGCVNSLQCHNFAHQVSLTKFSSGHSKYNLPYPSRGKM